MKKFLSSTKQINVWKDLTKLEILMVALKLQSLDYLCKKLCRANVLYLELKKH